MAAVWFWLLTLTTVLTLTVHTLLFLGRSLHNRAFEYYGRATAAFAAMVICAIYGTTASALLTLVGYGGLGQWTTARAFKWLMLLFTGVWVEIRDEEDWLNTTRPAVFIGNHQTELDVLVLGHVFPKYCSVTAKSSLKYWPFLGWFMAMSKTVFIERTHRDQALAAFDNAAKQMHSAGQSVYIFPEGTRSYYDHADLLPFKKGAFHLAVQAQVPVVPIVVGNYSNVLNMKKKIFQPGVIPIRILKPVETKDLTKEDVDSLMEGIRNNMLTELKALTAEAQKTGVALSPTETSGRLANGPARSTGTNVGLNAAA